MALDGPRGRSATDDEDVPMCGGCGMGLHHRPKADCGCCFRVEWCEDPACPRLHVEHHAAHVHKERA